MQAAQQLEFTDHLFKEVSFSDSLALYLNISKLLPD